MARAPSRRAYHLAASTDGMVAYGKSACSKWTGISSQKWHLSKSTSLATITANLIIRNHWRRVMHLANAVINHPEPTEYPSYYEKYISLVPRGEIIATLEQQLDQTLTLLRS